jgi:hypothetical protein
VGASQPIYAPDTDWVGNSDKLSAISSANTIPSKGLSSTYLSNALARNVRMRVGKSISLYLKLRRNKHAPTNHLVAWRTRGNNISF